MTFCTLGYCLVPKTVPNKLINPIKLISLLARFSCVGVEHRFNHIEYMFLTRSSGSCGLSSVIIIAKASDV